MVTLHTENLQELHNNVTKILITRSVERDVCPIAQSIMTELFI